MKEELISEIESWSLVENLPASIGSFKLNLDMSKDNGQYKIFSYKNTAKRKLFSIVYDQATKEYKARVCQGLLDYCDISFIAANLAELEKLIVDRMEKSVKAIDSFPACELDSLFLEKRIHEWPYGRTLANNIEGFQLYVRPEQSLKVINGSYVVIDYSDFSVDSNLIIYYNVFRDEFFGEKRIRNTPQMASVFDAKTLNELECNLSDHLISTIKEIRQQLALR